MCASVCKFTQSVFSTDIILSLSVLGRLFAHFSLCMDFKNMKCNFTDDNASFVLQF